MNIYSKNIKQNPQNGFCSLHRIFWWKTVLVAVFIATTAFPFRCIRHKWLMWLFVQAASVKSSAWQCKINTYKNKSTSSASPWTYILGWSFTLNFAKLWLRNRTGFSEITKKNRINWIQDRNIIKLKPLF